MDYDKLIDNLKQFEFVAYNYSINGEVLGMDSAEFESVMADAITAIESLRTENTRLNTLAELGSVRAKDYRTMRDRAIKAEADLARVMAERDAAIADLVFIARTYPVALCDDLVCKFCVHFQNAQTGCPGWEKNECFEWRGQKED